MCVCVRVTPGRHPDRQPGGQHYLRQVEMVLSNESED